MTPQNPVIKVFDSGIQSGARNMTIDRELLRRHAGGGWPDTLRFHRSRPTACVGYHQAIDRELRLDYCAGHGIETARRITGGGALYFDEHQQGISLIAGRTGRWGRLSCARLLQQFCEAMAAGLDELGLQAEYKFPNDLEIGGRKIASVFLAREGDSWLLQAVLLLDVDIRVMLEALRAPTEKLSADGLAGARERLISVRQCLGEVPPAQSIVSALSRGIASVMDIHADLSKLQSGPEISLDFAVAHAFDRRVDWGGEADLEAIWKTPGGVLRARVEYDSKAGEIRRAALAGDVHLHPADVFTQLEQGLVGWTPCMVEGAVHRIVGAARAELLGFSAEDIARVLQLAVEKAAAKDRLQMKDDRLMLHHAEDNLPTEMILAQAEAVLLPYCAKPVWCKWRQREDCPECGLCEVGEVYRLARERNMPAITITSYEHLTATLGAMQAKGTTAYVGMCCSNFFIKRHQAFQAAGMSAVLMDIAGANCYELKAESAAYAGCFEAQASLDMESVRQVMRFVPVRADDGTNLDSLREFHI
ncbi:MAG: lipoate--protein ligase family protein [Hydrogenophilales bacterium]|nr:lipoate--protein ligase family protein [Hydrogenophilales bacterium]